MKSLLLLAAFSLTSCYKAEMAPVKPTPKPSVKEDLVIQQREAQRSIEEAAQQAAEIKEQLYRAEQQLK